jgi:hypothetical protein
MSFNVLNLHEQRSLLDYLKRDPCLPEELVDVPSKLEVSITKLTDTVYIFSYFFFMADLDLIFVSLQILFIHPLFIIIQFLKMRESL